MAASPEPFSPSIFLNLPPTPRHDCNAEGKDPASSDDLILPFIERMFMEEDIGDDNFLYQQFPDLPALLQVQEPYAQILSDANTTLSVSSSDTNDFTTSIQMSSSSLLRDTDEAAMKKKAMLAVDGDNAALASAFFKGMEEANKFLPRDIKLSHGFATVQVKKEEEEEGSGNNCRGRKKRHNMNWDVLEAETGRKTKLMVPEPEEAGEVVDEMIAKGYELFLKEVEGLRISMGSAAEKKKNRKAGIGRSTDETVDLCTLLIRCAHAVAANNHWSAAELLMQIKQHSSPRGDATQRLAHCFAEGLEARLAGSGSQAYESLMAKRTSAVDFLKAYRLYAAACCFRMMAFKFANMTICRAIAGRKKLHIVDYGIHNGSQWPALLNFLSIYWPGGTPEVRITGIGFRPAARVEETGRRLSNYASQFGVPFRFHDIAAKWETVRADDLDMDPDEVLIVNSILHFGNLMDEGVDASSPGPRDAVLSNIRKIRPDVFILFVMNGSYSTPYFVMNGSYSTPYFVPIQLEMHSAGVQLRPVPWPSFNCHTTVLQWEKLPSMVFCCSVSKCKMRSLHRDVSEECLIHWLELLDGAVQVVGIKYVVYLRPLPWPSFCSYAANVHLKPSLSVMLVNSITEVQQKCGKIFRVLFSLGGSKLTSKTMISATVMVMFICGSAELHPVPRPYFCWHEARVQVQHHSMYVQIFMRPLMENNFCCVLGVFLNLGGPKSKVSLQTTFALLNSVTDWLDSDMGTGRADALYILAKQLEATHIAMSNLLEGNLTLGSALAKQLVSFCLLDPSLLGCNIYYAELVHSVRLFPGAATVMLEQHRCIVSNSFSCQDVLVPWMGCELTRDLKHQKCDSDIDDYFMLLISGPGEDWFSDFT